MCMLKTNMQKHSSFTSILLSLKTKVKVFWFNFYITFPGGGFSSPSAFNYFLSSPPPPRPPSPILYPFLTFSLPSPSTVLVFFLLFCLFLVFSLVFIFLSLSYPLHFNFFPFLSLLIPFFIFLFFCHFTFFSTFFFQSMYFLFFFVLCKNSVIKNLFYMY